MTTLYLIRHAEAEGNLYRRIHGRYDSIVTLRGKKQIAALAERFKDRSIDRVYSSDLTRSMATAQAAAAGRNLDIIPLTGLREVSMGAWEDLTWGEVERFEPEQLGFFNSDPLRWRVDGGEDYHTLQARITGALTDIAAQNSGKTVAAVSHGSAIRTFVCGVTGVEPGDIHRVPHCDNTAVTGLTFKNGVFTVDYYADNAHLPEALSTFAHQKWWRENTTYDSTNLRFVPFDLEGDGDRYDAYRRDAWEADYGVPPEDGRLLKKARENARENARRHSRAVSLALIYDTPVGAVELDVDAGAGEGVGVIELIYLIGEQRRNGMAVQLIGQAVSVFRSLGRSRLRMSVGACNERALAFCDRYGFERAGEIDDDGHRRIIMEMDITVK